MHKKFLSLLLFISNSVITMEKIVATHPLVTATEQNDNRRISEELEALQRRFSSSITNLLSCKSTQVMSILENNECLTFEKVTYAALAAAIKNKKARAAHKLLHTAPVCLHNNPEYLLHEAAKEMWKCDVFATQKRTLELMIEHGALAHQKHPITGKTPVEVAQETGADYEVCHFLKKAAQKQEEYEKNFKPYHKEVRIPPYYDIVSYESAQTLNDERRFEHYRHHCRVEYKPT